MTVRDVAAGTLVILAFVAVLVLGAAATTLALTYDRWGLAVLVGVVDAVVLSAVLTATLGPIGQ